MSEIENKFEIYLNKSIAKDKELLLSCTSDELPNIQFQVKYCQGLLNMIGRAVQKPESEMCFD